ncbi:MAG: 2-phospho-L-lactate transferase [Alphaproteobacteria bacterium]
MLDNIVILAGGVGGAKMVQGFAELCAPERLAVIGNVADDWEFHGLWVSPDIDTVTYTLAGLIDEAKGWGVREESFRALDVLKRLGKETWMQLGDQDLGLHIYRTERRRAGERPSLIARDIARKLGVEVPILLPTDDPIHTKVQTPDGWLAFQEYFVRERCSPPVYDVRFDGIESASATPEALAALNAAELIVIAPSNPIVSIGPILAVPGIRRAIERSKALRVAISPIVGGRTIKGPAADMMHTMGHDPSIAGVATLYRGLMDAFVVDERDRDAALPLMQDGLAVWLEQTVMQSRADKQRLAERIMRRAELALRDRGAA